MSIRSLSLSILLVMVFAAGFSPATAGTLVVVVRHAEKAAPEGDPELTLEGRRRAEALARTVSGLELDAIYSTPYRRTLDTAAPASSQTGLPIREQPIGDRSLEEWVAAEAERIVAENPDGSVLVVGHSNTVPLIVAALCGCDAGSIADDEYDAFFVVHAETVGRGEMIRVRYGE
ncbi:MAG: phosphoglycerate mutase family protein [Wenzhouxiangellaceae bacterium]|nr:phosphoglycerate mutase family protein [Wenzhouxiangellaceae bacterium]